MSNKIVFYLSIIGCLTGPFGASEDVQHATDSK
jgi:hypothetical protein